MANYIITNKTIEIIKNLYEVVKEMSSMCSYQSRHTLSSDELKESEAIMIYYNTAGYRTELKNNILFIHWDGELIDSGVVFVDQVILPAISLKEVTDKNCEKVFAEAIKQIEYKISRYELNTSFSHSFVYPTHHTGKNFPKIDRNSPLNPRIIKYFTENGNYQIQSINGPTAVFRLRWDRNRTHLTKGKPIKQNKPFTGRKYQKIEEKKKQVKSLSDVIKEIDELIVKKANLGYYFCKYYSKYARGKDKYIANHFIKKGFKINIYINGIFVYWKEPAEGTYANEMNAVATDAITRLSAEVFNKICAEESKIEGSNKKIYIGIMSKDIVQPSLNYFNNDKIECEYNRHKGYFIMRERVTENDE